MRKEFAGIVQCPRQLPLFESGVTRHLPVLWQTPCRSEKWTLLLSGPDRKPFASETTFRSRQTFRAEVALAEKWPQHFQMHLTSHRVKDRKCSTRRGVSVGAYPQAFFQPRIPLVCQKRGPTLPYL